MNDLKLSIIVITYNQEKYIRKSIESVMAQKIPYNYEVLIGEDHSTDKTADILHSMECILPLNYRIIYREENIGMNANLLDLIYMAQGEYVIILEGDDFWIDENKLVKQIGFLENNLDYVACSHRALIVDENSKERNKIHIAEKKRCGTYTFDDFRMWKLPGQTTTILMRNVFMNHQEYKELFIDNYPGDRAIAFILLINGKVMYTSEKMSAYRLVTQKSNSFSSTNIIDRNFVRMHTMFLYNLYEFSKKNNLDKRKEKKIAQLYFRQLFRDVFREEKCFPEKKFGEEYMNADCKMDIVLWITILPFLTVKEYIENYYWKN